MNTTNWPSTEITFTGAYTCAHHNDQQRAACPVCLVSALTAERDQLRDENSNLRAGRKACAKCDAPMAFEVSLLRERAERAEAELAAERDHWQEIAKAASAEREHNANVAQAMTAERDQLRAEVELWEAKCHELIAPHYIIDSCLRAAKFREALAFHPVLRKPKKEDAK